MCVSPPLIRVSKHYDRKGVDEAGDGIGPGKAALGYERGVEALVGDLVAAVYAADEKAQRQERPVAEEPRLEQQEDARVEPGRDEVQGVDGALSRIAVQVRPGDERHHDLRQVVHDHIQRVEEHAARVVQHQQADGKARNGVPQHGDHRSERYYREVACPESRLLRHVTSCRGRAFWSGTWARR